MNRVIFEPDTLEPRCPFFHRENSGGVRLAQAFVINEVVAIAAKHSPGPNVRACT